MGLLARLVTMAVLGRKNGYRRRAFRRLDPCRRDGTSARPPAPAPAAPSAPHPAPKAESGWVDVASVAEIPPGSVIEARVGDRPVALANVGGELFAVDGTCLHAGGPLGDGSLEGGILTCPNHGWTYDVTTGKCQVDEALCLARYRVRRHEGRVLVEASAI